MPSMRNLFVCLLPLALSLGGCPQKTASPADLAEANQNPYKNVMPQKMKADVEAAQKKEEDRDDKVLDKAKE
jgi:hypothetical protein